MERHNEIESLRERLKTEGDQQERWALQRLLFQQMYRIGLNEKLREVIEREIGEWKGWIECQQLRMQRLERVGRYEKRLLLLAQHTLTVHELHRRRILELLGVGRAADVRMPPM
jgi:hypothetical protein